jgi:hypothetical protein
VSLEYPEDRAVPRLRVSRRAEGANVAGRSARKLWQNRLERGRLGVYWIAARDPKWEFRLDNRGRLTARSSHQWVVIAAWGKGGQRWIQECGVL